MVKNKQVGNINKTHNKKLEPQEKIFVRSDE